MANKAKWPKAALSLSKIIRIGDFLTRMRGIILDFVNNAAVFTAPVPTTTVMTGHVDDLDAAQAAAQTRMLGAASTRDLKYNIVLKKIYKWQEYVQSLANEEADYQAAYNLIVLSGFDVKVNGVFQKPDLAIKPMITPGTVKLIGRAAAKRASYEWQMSSNNAASWTSLPTTLKASTTVSGLTSGTRYLFRVRSVTKEGTSAWTAHVSIVIQ